MITSWTPRPGYQEQSQTFYQGTALGDPHITGFDGVTFDFKGQAGACYCFYADDRLVVNVRLAQSPPPHPLDSTIISDLCVIYNNEINHYTKRGQMASSVRNFGPNKIMVVRAQSGLPAAKRRIQGIKGGRVWVALPEPFDNLDISMNVQPSGQPTGIMGQTCLPTEQRRPNEEFQIPHLGANERL